MFYIIALVFVHMHNILSIPDSLHDYALVCVYVALKNFQDMAHRGTLYILRSTYFATTYSMPCFVIELCVYG